MALPRWLARLNRAVFNPAEKRRGKRPVLEHIGRVSGAQFMTPLDAHQTDEGVIFTPLYGSQTDWLRNVLSAGRATLHLDGEAIELTRPRLIEVDELPETIDRPARWLGIEQCLHLDRT